MTEGVDPIFDRLRAAVEEGLGPHHDVTGDCAVRFIDRSNPHVALSFQPGEVTLIDAPERPRGTLWITEKALQVLVTGIAFDFRAPELQHVYRFDGDAEFVVTAVVLALRRPTLETQEAFRRAEALSRGVTFSGIERVPVEQFGERLQARVPFIVTGALGDWPAVRSFDSWLQQRADVQLGQLTDDAPQLGDFVRRALAQHDLRSYTHGTALCAALLPDFPVPDVARGLKLTPAQLWLGAGKDAQTPITRLHRDDEAGLLGHVHGRKRFTVFPPHQADCLYVRPGCGKYQHCWVRPHRPDLNRYPRYREATPVDFVLEPGELLVQPAGWFHCVYSLDPLTASVSRFFTAGSAHPSNGIGTPTETSGPT